MGGGGNDDRACVEVVKLAPAFVAAALDLLRDRLEGLYPPYEKVLPVLCPAAECVADGRGKSFEALPAVTGLPRVAYNLEGATYVP